MGFQAVIKSAASAASLDPRKNQNNPRKNREKIKEKLPFWAFYIGIKLNFQAVIKSAASAASPPAWGAPDDGARWDDGAGRATDRIRATARGRSPDLGFPDLIP